MAFVEPEYRIVNVADIAEFPTRLGSRCLLLKKLGLDAYFTTEEELLEALTESAGNSELLRICMESSRCSVFWEKFREGTTPFTEYDPIYLNEYNGRYWVVEEKHRVCLAKRAGIEKIEAFVYIDDRQIVHLETKRMPCASSEDERVEITLWEEEQDDIKKAEGDGG